MKKILVFLLTLILAFSCTACGSGKKENPPAETSGTVTEPATSEAQTTAQTEDLESPALEEVTVEDE